MACSLKIAFRRSGWRSRASLEGVQNALTAYNAVAADDLPSVEELFQDWVVTMYLDAEGTKYDLRSFELGSEEASWGWTTSFRSTTS